MGRPRNPERGKSMERFLKSDGKISIKELAEAAGVPESRIRKWKSLDKWEEALKNKPKKRGGQKGNKNAAGKTPAKNGNKNAVTHGAFASATIEDLPPEKQKEVEGVNNIPDAMGKITEELKALMVRRGYLETLLTEYEDPEAQGRFYADKVVHMIVPKSLDDIAEESNMGIKHDCTDPDPQGNDPETFKTAMKSIVKSSAFDRAQKIEAELNKVHGRIIKLIDSLKSYELERRRIDIAERQLELARQKATGALEVDTTGEVTVVDDVEDVEV